MYRRAGNPPYYVDLVIITTRSLPLWVLLRDAIGNQKHYPLNWRMDAANYAVYNHALSNHNPRFSSEVHNKTCLHPLLIRFVWQSVSMESAFLT